MDAIPALALYLRHEGFRIQLSSHSYNCDKEEAIEVFCKHGDVGIVIRNDTWLLLRIRRTIHRAMFAIGRYNLNDPTSIDEITTQLDTLNR